MIGQFIEPISSERTISPFESGPDVFVSTSYSLWSRKASNFDEMLDETLEWPFSISIANLSNDPLPASLTERKACFGVRYEVYAHIRRGALRSNKK